MQPVKDFSTIQQKISVSSQQTNVMSPTSNELRDENVEAYVQKLFSPQPSQEKSSAAARRLAFVNSRNTKPLQLLTTLSGQKRKREEEPPSTDLDGYETERYSSDEEEEPPRKVQLKKESSSISTEEQEKLDAILYSISGVFQKKEQTKEKNKPSLLTISDAAARAEALRTLEHRLYVTENEALEKFAKEISICYGRGKEAVGKKNIDLTILEEEAQTTSTGFSYTICGLQGRRKTMEDTHLVEVRSLLLGGVEKKMTLFAVCDGHGGIKAAEFVRDHFGKFLERNIQNYWDPEQYYKGITNAMVMSCVELDEAFNHENKRAAVGTTLACSCILDDKLWTINTGDSRVVLVLPEPAAALQLSDDAVAGGRFNSSIERRGGHPQGSRLGHPTLNPKYVHLGVARDIGEDFFEGAVSARPKISCIDVKKLPPQAQLAIVCDGVTSILSTSQLGAAVREGAGARSLVEGALHHGSTDNITALVVNLT